MGDQFWLGLALGLNVMWALALYAEHLYRKGLVMKADPRCRTAEKIDGKFYYVVPEDEYVTMDAFWYAQHPSPFITTGGAHMTQQEILTRAAAILKEDSESLFDACTLDGQWVINDDSDRKAKADHDELIELSTALLAMAGAA